MKKILFLFALVVLIGVIPINEVDAIDTMISYDITGGSIVRFTTDVESHSLVITMTASQDGSLVITLSRDLIDAKRGDQDDTFFVLVDGEEVDFEEITTSTDRTLTIQFYERAKNIEIIGTTVNGDYFKPNTTPTIPINDAFANIPDTMYKDHVYSIKSSYYDLVEEIRSEIVLSENTLSGLNFENSEAKKKIETAQNFRWEVLSSNHESSENLKQVESLLKNKQYQYSYNKLRDIDKQLYTTKDNLYKIVSEVTKARDLEKQYQENKQKCFLFWCDLKNTYGILDPKIRNLESNLDRIENKLKKLETSKNSAVQSLQKTEIALKNQDIQNLENLRKQDQYEFERQAQSLQEQIRQKQSESDRQVQIEKQQQAEIQKKQLEIQNQELQRQQEQQQYKEAIEAKERQILQQLAKDNPLIQQIISGKIRFYVHPLPNYAGVGVSDTVNKMFDGLDNKDGFERVYSEEQADLHFQWVRDFTPDRIGQNYKNFNQIGLGTTNCFGDWRPFDSITVAKIIWHELGHSIGYPHNNDPNNIMYVGGTGNDFVSDYDEITILDEGHYQTIPFCGSGNYKYTLKSNDQYNGFQVYVITPETNPKDFLNGNGGKHWANCGSDGQKMVSYTGNCNVSLGSKLLINNPDEITQTSAINIQVEITNTDQRKLPDMNFNESELVYSKELLNYVRKLF